MELHNLLRSSLKMRQWSSRKNVKVIRLGGSAKRSWRFRVIPKLRVKMIISPVKLWSKIKGAYINMMLNLMGGNNGGYLSNGNLFGGKRIPRGRQVVAKYSNSEFENRLICEIYKSMVPSMELYNR